MSKWSRYWCVVVKMLVLLAHTSFFEYHNLSSDAIKAQEHLLIYLYSLDHLCISKTINSDLKILVFDAKNHFVCLVCSEKIVHEPINVWYIYSISYLLCICNKNHKIFNKININLYSTVTNDCCLADDFPWCSSA